MSDGLVFALIVALAVLGASAVGFIAGNAIELERGLDVPDAVELD